MTGQTSQQIDTVMASPSTANDNASKKRGRPAKPAPPMVAPISVGMVEHIKLADVDLADTTFMFRAALRIGDLKQSILEQGQQMPIVVREIGESSTYQLISGFRRTAAISEIGWETVAAIVRRDLDDEGAFRASVLENTARKTYADIDRAIVMRSLQEHGMSSTAVAELMGLKLRQKNNIASLLKLPDVVQEALALDEPSFTTTHAITLRQMAGRYDGLDYNEWIDECRSENYSISQLKRAINARYRTAAQPKQTTIFNDAVTDWDKGEIRLMPVKISLRSLSDSDRDQLRQQLESLLAKL